MYIYIYIYTYIHIYPRPWRRRTRPKLRSTGFQSGFEWRVSSEDSLACVSLVISKLRVLSRSSSSKVLAIGYLEALKILVLLTCLQLL